MDLFFLYIVVSLALATVDGTKWMTGDQKFIVYIVIIAMAGMVTAAELIARGFKQND